MLNKPFLTKQFFVRIISTVLILSIVFCFSSCTDKHETNSVPIQTTTKPQSDSAQENNDTQTTAPSYQEDNTTSISATCDKILASGYDADQNYYELVANETEDYSGTKIEMGVIKNNEWLIPLTANSPFVSDTGLLVGARGNFKGSIYEEKFAIFNYIGAGCFIYSRSNYDSGIIWNSNTGKYYHDTNELYYYAPQAYTSDHTYELKNKTIINNDGLFLLRPNIEGNYKLLNANTMEISDINLEEMGYSYFSYPLSEGLFAIINSTYSPQTANGFYDITGKKIIDLSQYTFTEEYVDAAFINGECSFEIKNDQGTKYYITIDKTGNVINSVQS